MKINPEETRVTNDTRRIEPPKEASLVQIYGPSLGERVVIDSLSMSIGRDEANDIVLDSDSVSRVHANILSDGEKIVLEDKDSTNGSLVNDREVTQHELRNGDIIKIGSVVFKFISGGNAEALYHEEIYRMTISDGLTGIPNRRYFEDFLERELARSGRYDRPLALAMFDIDHFKSVNDSFGHLAGDCVLRKMAQSIKKQIRREELVARYGGEEFAIVMPETAAEKAMQFAEKVRELVENTTFEFDDQKIPVTISIGVAQRSDAIKRIESFIASADKALYAAKEAGRNRVVAAD